MQNDHNCECSVCAERASLNREGREHPSYDNPRDPFASPDRLPPSSSAGNAEADALRRKLQLHAGDMQSLSGEVDMWRERALEAEEELARLRTEPQQVKVREALQEAIDVFEGMNDDEINMELLLPRLKEALK